MTSPHAGTPGEGEALPVRPSWLPADRELRAFLGDSALYPFYRLRLVEYIARLLPFRGPCHVLDVGAGDGSLGTLFERFRPRTSVIGVEVKEVSDQPVIASTSSKSVCSLARLSSWTSG